MLNLGIRAHDFGTLPIETLAENIAGKGFSSIQLALSKALPGVPPLPGVLSPGFAMRIREILARKGIAVAVLGCYINPIHPDPEIRRRELARFREHLAFARDFGCPVVATETGSRNADCSYNPETETEPAFRDLVDSVRLLTDTAEKFGTFVAVEGVRDQHTISTHERMVRLLEEIDSPNLRVLYDPVNFLPLEHTPDIQHASIREAFELFGDRIVAVHAKDFTMVDGKKRGDLPAGTGMFDYPYFFRLLKERKPGVHILLESTTPGTMDSAREFIRRTFDAV